MELRLVSNNWLNLVNCLFVGIRTDFWRRVWLHWMVHVSLGSEEIGFEGRCGKVSFYFSGNYCHFYDFSN